MLAFLVTIDPYETLRPRVEEWTRLGRSRWQIADELNAAGVPTKSGKPWNETVVSQLCDRFGIQPRRSGNDLDYADMMIDRLARVTRHLGREPRVEGGQWDAESGAAATALGINLAGPTSYARRFRRVRTAIEMALAHVGDNAYGREITRA